MVKTILKLTAGLLCVGDDCCVSFQESAVNGPVENGGDVTVSLEEHKQLVQEKEELAEQVKEMEKRLEELKLKNNVRRRNTLRYNMELGPSLFCRPCVTTAGGQGTMLPPWRRPAIRNSSRHTERQRWVVRTRVCVCVCVHCVILPFPPSLSPLPFQQRCKAARAEALTEARDAQKVLCP